MKNKEYKIIKVLSRFRFNNYIKELNLNDETIHLHKDICIIEFFNSDILETSSTGRCIDNIDNFKETEYLYKNDFKSRPFKFPHENVFQVVCDDIHRFKTSCVKLPGDNEFKDVALTLFRWKDAIELYNFIRKNVNCKKFIIHCAAGISRSGAVGMFLKNLFEKKNIPVHVPEYNNIQANDHILGFLNKTSAVYEHFEKNPDDLKNYSLDILPNHTLLFPCDNYINTETMNEYIKYHLNINDDNAIKDIKIKSINELLYEKIFIK